MPTLKRQYDTHISLAIQQEGFHQAVFCDKILAHLNLHFHSSLCLCAKRYLMLSGS